MRTKSKLSANSAMEASPASTTSGNSISNESTTTPSSTATPVSTTSAINVATSNTTSTRTSASTAIPNAKVTSKDTTPVIKNSVSAIKETSATAKEKEPAPPTSSVSTEAVPLESSSSAPALTTATTGKMSAMDNLVEQVPALKQATPALYNSTRDSVGSYVSLVATYMASFTIAQVFLKAADLGLETTDGLLKLTANHKVDPILTGLRRVRSEATSLRKEGIVLNGTAKAKILEEATLVGAIFEIFGLGFFFNQPWNSRGGADDEGLLDDDDAIDIVSALPSKTRSGLVL